MSRFDFNNPLDFARATLSPVAGLLNQFSPGEGEWQLLECSYLSDATRRKNPQAKPVLLHVFKSVSEYQAGLDVVSDSGGRRKVKYEYPYVDGQTTDDLGARPENFELNILFHGPRYLEGLRAFLREAGQATPGTLVHPIRGSLRVAVETYDLTHSQESRKAVLARVVFTTHSFTAGSLRTLEPKKENSVKSKLLAAVQGVQRIETAINQVQDAILTVQSLKNSLEQQLTEYSAAYLATLRRLNRTFNDGSSSDLPLLNTVSQGGTTNAAGQQVSETFTTLVSPNDPYSGIPTDPDPNVVPVLAAKQAEDEVNARRAEVSAAVSALEAADALQFHPTVLLLKQSAVDLQEVLEAGLASSRAAVGRYRTPRLMTLREVAFAVQLDVQRAYEIALLNPTLESTNFVPEGTLLEVPVA